jgi:23S rRNA (uracil1939-C5)-methyltransferase
MSIGRFTVALPPESFLQPTKEGEAIIQGLVREEAGSTRRIADLFSGCGTFALALAEGRSVQAVDSADAQIEALTAAGQSD